LLSTLAPLITTRSIRYLHRVERPGAGYSGKRTGRSPNSSRPGYRTPRARRRSAQKPDGNTFAI